MAMCVFLKSKSYFSAQILPNLIFSRLEFHCELKYWMFVKGRLRHIFYIDIDIECLRHIFWQVLHSTANIANFVPFVNFQLILSNADVHSGNQNSFWEGKRRLGTFKNLGNYFVFSFISERELFRRCGKLLLFVDFCC